MAHGENAEKRGHCGREYWSPRLRGMFSWGAIAKRFTHRHERRQARRAEWLARNFTQADADALAGDWAAVGNDFPLPPREAQP